MFQSPKACIAESRSLSNFSKSQRTSSYSCQNKKQRSFAATWGNSKRRSLARGCPRIRSNEVEPRVGTRLANVMSSKSERGTLHFRAIDALAQLTMKGFQVSKWRCAGSRASKRERLASLMSSHSSSSTRGSSNSSCIIGLAIT